VQRVRFYQGRRKTRRVYGKKWKNNKSLRLCVFSFYDCKSGLFLLPKEGK
jgi:hypothetical protein